MPNRKTFDEREKYDHSAHSTSQREKGDLASHSGGDVSSTKRNARKSGQPGTGQTRNSR